MLNGKKIHGKGKNGKTAEQVLKAQLRKANTALKGERKLFNKLARLQEKVEKTKKVTATIRADRESCEQFILYGKLAVVEDPPPGFFDEGIAVEPRSFTNPIASR